MRPATAPFPFPGSLARVDGLIWRIHQLNADGTALLLRGEGDGLATGASFTRRSPLADLENPALDALPVDGLDRIGVGLLRRLDWVCIRNAGMPRSLKIWQRNRATSASAAQVAA